MGHFTSRYRTEYYYCFSFLFCFFVGKTYILNVFSTETASINTWPWHVFFSLFDCCYVENYTILYIVIHAFIYYYYYRYCYFISLFHCPRGVGVKIYILFNNVRPLQNSIFYNATRSTIKIN